MRNWNRQCEIKIPLMCLFKLNWSMPEDLTAFGELFILFPSHKWKFKISKVGNDNITNRKRTWAKKKKKLFAKALTIGFSHCKLLRHRIPSTDFYWSYYGIEFGLLTSSSVYWSYNRNVSIIDQHGKLRGRPQDRLNDSSRDRLV